MGAPYVAQPPVPGDAQEPRPGCAGLGLYRTSSSTKMTLALGSPALTKRELGLDLCFSRLRWERGVVSWWAGGLWFTVFSHLSQCFDKISRSQVGQRCL